MTYTLNSHRRALMHRARKLAGQAQSPAGVIRGDLVGIAYEDLLDTCIELLRVCPLELMHVPAKPDVIPCAGCDTTIPVERSGRRYCTEACRKHVKNQEAYDRRRAAA